MLDSSPPCQGFSVSGLRKISDERNDLFIQTKKFIKELNPKVFIIENVDGMIKENSRACLINIYLN